MDLPVFNVVKGLTKARLQLETGLAYIARLLNRPRNVIAQLVPCAGSIFSQEIMIMVKNTGSKIKFGRLMKNIITK